MKGKKGRKDPLLDGWVCPNCGQTGRRHGRGGARACKSRTQGPLCQGLTCMCHNGRCYSSDTGRGWRRSPCLDALCAHCGWRGELRSKDFERDFGLSRCPVHPSGIHQCQVILEPAEHASIAMRLTCTQCGTRGASISHPIHDVEWSRPPAE